MAPRRIPAVNDDHLHPHPAAAPIPVGSPAWFAWLADPAHVSFAYRTADGSVTLRRERRGAGSYWYAYRGQGGRVRKIYAGKADELTAERLRALATALADGPTPATATGVRIRLFGPARLEREGQSTAPPSAKALALLAYLAAHHRPQPRERLLAMLWPESDERAAHKNLRNLLWRLRAALGPQVVEGEAELALSEHTWVDVRAIEAAQRVVETPGADAAAVLQTGEEVVRLYGGDLLDGLVLDQAADFEHWLARARDRYREAYLGSLLALAAAYATARRWADVGHMAQAGLAVDALSEPLARALMEAHARLGDRAGALRQYDRLRAALDQELGVAPLPETEALRAAILSGSLAPEPSAPAPVHPGAGDLAAAAEHALAPASGVAAGYRAAAEAARYQDWGEAPDTTGFVGRRDELILLKRWVVEEHCRLVAVLGMGGIGKTSLVAALAQAVVPAFERIYWRSLRDAPLPGEWLGGAIGFLSDQQVVPPTGDAERLVALLELLRARSCLLVLDNFETLFEPGLQEGRYRAGLAGYGRLLEALGTAGHQSCLMLTSREAPPELAILGGHAVRSIEPGGLGIDEARALLAPSQVAGTGEEWAELIARFGGNGLALKLVGASIRELFDGEIGQFLGEAGTGSVFGGIRRLLAGQVERTSAPEQLMLRALAVEREPVRAAALLAALGPRIGRSAVLEAVEGLRRRSLVERVEVAGAAALTLQSVVLEYVTDRLVEDMAEEIDRGEPVRLIEQPLIQAQARDHVRQSQERLIGAPILQRLQSAGGGGSAEQRLLALLDGWRGRPAAEQGFGPGSIVNLLRLLRGDLRGMDLSRLAIRQAYLAEVEAQDASLVDTDLAEAVLAEGCEYPTWVALSADSAWLAAGTAAGEVHLWRVAGRTPLVVVRGHTGAVWGVALSADGGLLASGGLDGAVRLWEAGSGRPLAALQGHTGAVWSVALSADGGVLASGGQDHTVRLWEAASGRPLAALQGHTGAVWGVALSADGGLLTSGGDDGAVRLWDVRSGRPLAALRGHTGTVWSVAISADGGLLASGGLDGTVRLWEARSERPLATLRGHEGGVRSVALSADGELLASGGLDGAVRLWEAGSGRPLAAFQGHAGGTRSVALSADGGLLASGGLDGAVRLWEAGSGRPLAALRGQNRAVWSVALSTDGGLLASGGDDGTVRLWEAASGRPLATLRGHTGTVWSVALSARGGLLASGGLDGVVRLWEAASGRPLAALRGHTGAVYSVALSTDGGLLASGGLDGVVRLWEAASGRPLAALRGHTGTVWSVAISADGGLLASGGLDGTVRLWETGSGRPLAVVQGHEGGVRAVTFSTVGGPLASAGFDGVVRLWEVGSGQPLATLQGHVGGVMAVVFSANGELLASAGFDGTVRLWEVGSGQPLAALRGHTGAVWSVALSADGGLLASAGMDGMVRLWEARGGTSLHVLRSDRGYERLDITGLASVTEAQRAALLALGAVDRGT